MHIGLPKSIKRITNPVVGRIPIRIASGVNRGLRWSLAAAGSGYGSGKRESRQMQVIWNLLRDDDTVWDIGAHYGFITMAAARRVHAGHVHAFEPGRSNHWFLAQHVRWNHLPNVTVHNCAVGNMNGTTSFGGGTTSKQHRLGGGDELVHVRTVESLVSSGEAHPPSFIKMDVEGAEADILEHGLKDFGTSTRLLIAVHSQLVYERCVESLRAAGYAFIESERLRRYRSAGWNGDADLFAYGPEFSDNQTDRAMLEQIGF
jgi:FkbM family methyltransferase